MVTEQGTLVQAAIEAHQVSPLPSRWRDKASVKRIAEQEFAISSQFAAERTALNNFFQESGDNALTQDQWAGLMCYTALARSQAEVVGYGQDMANLGGRRTELASASNYEPLRRGRGDLPSAIRKEAHAIDIREIHDKKKIQRERQLQSALIDRLSTYSFDATFTNSAITFAETCARINQEFEARNLSWVDREVQLDKAVQTFKTTYQVSPAS